MALNAPRTLNAPIDCRLSGLIHSGRSSSAQPSRDQRRPHDEGAYQLGGRLNVLNCHHLHGIKSGPCRTLLSTGGKAVARGRCLDPEPAACEKRTRTLTDPALSKLPLIGRQAGDCLDGPVDLGLGVVVVRGEPHERVHAAVCRVEGVVLGDRRADVDPLPGECGGDWLRWSTATGGHVCAPVPPRSWAGTPSSARARGAASPRAALRAPIRQTEVEGLSYGRTKTQHVDVAVLPRLEPPRPIHPGEGPGHRPTSPRRSRRRRDRAARCAIVDPQETRAAGTAEELAACAGEHVAAEVCTSIRNCPTAWVASSR